MERSVFAVSPVENALDEITQRRAATPQSPQPTVPSTPQAAEKPRAAVETLIPEFEAAADRYGVPPNVLMAAAVEAGGVGDPADIDRVAAMFKQRLDAGATLDDVLQETFVAVSGRRGPEATAFKDRVLERSYLIADELYPEEPEPQAQPLPLAKPEGATFLDRLGANAGRGWDNMRRSLDTTRAVVGGGWTPESIDTIADNIIASADANEAARAGRDPQELEIEKALDHFGESEGVWGTVKAAGDVAGTAIMNPKGLALGTAEQVANAAPTIAGAASGIAGGGALGGVAGSVVPGVGTAVGAGIGASIGGRAGAGLGTAVGEFGNELQQAVTTRLADAGKEPSRENIKAILSDPEVQDEITQQALTKGITLGAIDAVFFGLAGKVATVPAKTVAGKAGRAVAAGGVELASEPAGEAGSQLAARGEIDKADVAAEAVYGAGQAAATATAAGTVEGAAKALKARRRAVVSDPGGDIHGQTVTINPDQGRAEGTGMVRVTDADGNDRVIGEALLTEAPLPDEPVPELPAAEPTGPLGRAMQVAPTVAPLPGVQAAPAVAPGDGSRVTLSAEGLEPIPGTVVGVTDASTIIRGDDGNSYEVTSEEIDAGTATLTPEAPSAPGAPVTSGAGELEAPKAMAPPPVAKADGASAGSRIKPAAQKAPKTPDRPLTDYSEPELRDRMKYLAAQARARGGWNKTLTQARREVEAEIDGRTALGAGGVGGEREDLGDGRSIAGDDAVRGDIDAAVDRADQPVRGGDAGGGAVLDEAGAGLPATGMAEADARDDVVAVPEPALDDTTRWNRTPLAERKKILDTAGVKRSEKAAWQTFTPEIKAKLVAARDGDRGQPADRNPVDIAAHEAATSLTNDRPEPSQAQKEAGNYKLGHVKISGLDLSIENPAGSERKGVDRGGKPWSVEMQSHYGYIKRTEGKDGDHVDVFVKPGTTDLADDAPVFVVNQRHPSAGDRKYGGFDEHKVMLGFGTPEEARRAYLANYSKGWQGLGSLTPMTLNQFRTWLEIGDQTKPAGIPRIVKTEPVPVAKVPDAVAVAPKKETPKAKALRHAREIADYYTPGNIVQGYGKSYDRVIAFDAAGTRGFSVTVISARPDGKGGWEDVPGARERFHSTEPTRQEMKAGPASRAKAGTSKPSVAPNTVFTEDAADKARAVLRAKLKGQLNSGIDPEIMQAGITLAGYHIEKGARTLAAYARAMIADLGEEVRPYLKSWYMGVKYDPRASAFDGMSSAAEVEAADIDSAAPAAEDQDDGTEELGQPGEGALEGVPAGDVRGAEGQRDAGAVASGSGDADARGDDAARAERVPRARGVGDRAREVPVPAGGDERADGAERVPGAVERSDGVAEPRAADDGRSGRGSLIPASGTAAADRPADFTIVDPAESAGQKSKFKANLAAIRLLKKLDAEGRSADRAEQAILSKYAGWGGIPQAFERSDGSFSKGWESEGAELRDALTAEELRAAAASTRNAHYTSSTIVSAMWSAMQRLGVTGGRILEPSVGVGNFFGLMPAGMRKASALHGVELDRITGGIAKHLYPGAKIASPMGFQDYTIPDGYFDAVIGNPPFGSEKLYDKSRSDLSGFSIHNYFFAKSIDGLKPGGILAMVVTNRMMDAASDAARDYISARADLVAAFRLPNDAFAKNAGTTVTTDIVILRKKVEGDNFSGAKWSKIVDHLDKNGVKVPLNEYFVANPDNMFGEFGAFGSMYRKDDPALVAREGQDTSALLRKAVARLPERIAAPAQHAPTVEDITRPVTAANVRVGSMFRSGDNVMIRTPDSLGEARSSEVEFSNEKARQRVEGMLDVRDALTEVRLLQLSPTAALERIETARKRLNKVYDAFVRANGPINIDANKRLFRDDPSWPQIAALENDFDRGVSAAVAKSTGEEERKPSAKKAAIFSRRTQSPHSAPTSAASAKDALVASLSELGRVDLPLMMRLYRKGEETILGELGDLVYRDPVSGWVTREEYLSGNVKAKLAQAQRSAKLDGDLRRNVEALEAVQPADIAAIDISVKPGSHWLPPAVMADFVDHLAERAGAKAVYSDVASRWTLRFEATQAAEARWSTRRTGMTEIVEAAANQRTITVRDKLDEKTTVVNEEQTQLANDKVKAVKEEWGRWLWSDDKRRDQLARLYNDMFNTDVQRRFDGSHLTFPGKVSDDIIALRPHQADAVWRVIQSDTTLLDHVVGAGKTFTMIAAAMEMRRMGLAKKPLFDVPNHLVGQWAADFNRLYPGANVLATTKKDFQKENRKKLVARIATGDWDAVIISHSSFGKIAVSPEAEAIFIEQQISDLVKSREAMRVSEGAKDTRNVKQIEAEITKRNEKLKKLLDAGRKDDNLYWDELGIDALFTDEAHEFKNLEFSTSMQRVAGLGNPAGSQKATDKFIKVQEVLRTTGGRGVTFATGTPISNTMAEMYTVQRYLDYKTLKAQGLAHFDAWARMFGEVVTDWELSPSGQYKMNSRFAKFVNMPELMQRYLSFADVIDRSDINRMLASQGKVLPVPKVTGGKPENVVVERSDDQADYIGRPIKDADGNDTDRYPSGSLVWRAENLPKRPGPGDDNMLKVMGDARKAALDMRLIDPAYADFPGSKINAAAQRIKGLYRKWHTDKGAQLVFIDLSTPKNAKAAEAARIRALIEAADAGDDAAKEALDRLTPDDLMALESEFSVYDDLKEKLIREGIPEREIAFIHDAKTDLQKEELFGKVRSGRIRVLLGSTAKMGAGMNVQTRLVALHHLDAPWRPSDLEQREGRIIRQGNVLYERDPDGFEVGIYRYASRGTLDSRMWQTIEAKARFIEQVRKGASGSREIEDVAGEASNAAEMKAASSGNPLILEEMDLRQRVRRLENERHGHDGDQYRIRDSIRRTAASIERSEALAATMEEDAKVSLPEKFEITIRGTVYDSRKEAGAAILAVAAEMDRTGAEITKLGSFGGFKIVLNRLGGDVFSVSLTAAGAYETNRVNSAADPQGLAIRITNSVRNLKPEAAELRKAVASQKAELPKLQAQIGEWSKDGDLAEARRLHAETLDKLRPKKKAAAEKEGDAPKASVAEAGGDGFTSVADAASHLRSSAYGIQVGKMLDAGKVVIHADAASLPGNDHPEGAIQAMTASDGIIHLVASNLTPETATAVLLHEMFHAGAEALLGERRWTNLLARVRSILAVQQGRAEADRTAWWRDALARVEAADVPADRQAEELAAYAIENRATAPSGLRETVDNLVGALKAWLWRRFGVQMGEVTPGQLVALAVAALRSTEVGGRDASANSLKSMRRKVAAVVTAALQKTPTGARAIINSVSGLVIQRAKSEGYNLDGYSHVIDEDAVRHIFRRHGDEKIERGRGQLPITPEIFKYIPDVIASPNKIIFAGRAKGGLDVVAYVKRLPSGKLLYLEEVRTGRRHLATKSLRLFPDTMNVDAVASTLDLNAQDDGGTERKIVDPSDGDKGNLYSVAADPAPTDAEVDGWFKSKLSSTLTNAMPALLGAAPLRPMLEELGRPMPATRDYLRTKQAMDAMRDTWHAKVDAVAQRWTKYRIRDKAENLRLMDLMHESTLAQVDPSKPFVPFVTQGDRTALNRGDPGVALEIAERALEIDERRQKAYAELQPRFAAFSEEARALYVEVRNSYAELADESEAVVIANLSKAIEVGRKRAERRHKAEIQEIKDNPDLTATERKTATMAADKRLKEESSKGVWSRRARLTRMKKTFETNRLKGPYFPLARFGDFFVTVRDADGKVISFSRFESNEKQIQFAKEMRREYGDGVEIGVLSNANDVRRQVDPNFVADIDDILSGSDVGDGIRDQVWQRYLESLPDMSARKARIHRLGRAGFHRDALRAFASHTFHGAHQLARLKHAMDLQEAVEEAREQARNAPDPVRSGLVVNEMEHRNAYVMNPTGAWWSQAITSAAFVYSLSVSPAAAIVNVSQTVMIGVPVLAAYEGSAIGGVAKASAALSKAMLDFTRGRGQAEHSPGLSDDERRAMIAAYDLGLVDRSQAHDLAGVAETGMEYSASRQKVMNAISFLFHHAERFNREVTFLAAYRMAKEKGEAHSDAIETASSLTWKTHFDYQNTSRPRYMQRDAAKVFLVFRNYSVNMLYRLFRDIHQSTVGESAEVRKEARMQLFGVTAMMALNAGIKGTWFFGIAMMLAGLMFGLDDPEEELKKAVIDLLGPTVGGIALDGLPGYLTGTSVSERIGMPDLWFRSSDRMLEGEDEYNYWLQQAVGAAPSMIRNFVVGSDMIGKGHTYRGVETMMPKAVKDLMRAYRFGTEGALTLKGDEIIGSVGSADIIKQAIGFTPARLAEQYGRNSSMKNREQKIKDEKSHLLARYYQASKKRDIDAVGGINDEIRDYNKKYPINRITPQTIIQSMRARKRASDRNEGGVMLDKKLDRLIRSEAAPSIY